MYKNINMEIRGVNKKNEWDYENAFYWLSDPSRINKIITHYELYKSISKLPGDVLELGVYKGNSILRLATFRNTLENDFSRKIIGFDTFDSFPKENLSLNDDLEFIKKFEKAEKGLSIEELETIIKAKGFKNIELQKGNIFKTIPQYLEKNPQTRIAFLHLDMDVKEPTAFALEALFERVVRNGIIVVDDYNAVSGATIAIDEFIADKKLIVEKTKLNNTPSYIIKN